MVLKLIFVVLLIIFYTPFFLFIYSQFNEHIDEKQSEKKNTNDKIKL